jgi:hypothetical protein
MKTKLFLLVIALMVLLSVSCVPNTASAAGGCKYPATTVVAYSAATQTFSLVQGRQVVATATSVSGTLNFGVYGNYGVTYHSYTGGKKLDKSAPWGWYKLGSAKSSGRIYVGACSK